MKDSKKHQLSEEIQCAGRQEWRQWLQAHHDLMDEAWLVYYKKHTGRPSISYVESVEEAICFGWIDGKKRSIDNDRYAHRFSPRRPKSKWSPVNIKRATALIEKGLMQAAGLRSFERRLAYQEDFLELRNQQVLALPADMRARLKEHGTAWKNYVALTPGYQKQYILWLTMAKRQQTREKRLIEAIQLLSENKKLGMK
jgi:uncharacterized protein YdeI (YjbR/CyaY-like superfamily)